MAINPSGFDLVRIGDSRGEVDAQGVHIFRKIESKHLILNTFDKAETR